MKFLITHKFCLTILLFHFFSPYPNPNPTINHHQVRLAETYPEPDDKEKFVRSFQYQADYESFIPNTYPWPGMNE